MPRITRHDGDSIDPLLSLDDLSRLLNISRRTAERLLSAGRLPRADLRLGRMPRWRPETLRRFVEGGGR